MGIIMYAEKTLKETAAEAINKLHDTANIDEIMYRIYLIDKVRKGEEAIKEGRSISVEALKEEMKLW